MLPRRDASRSEGRGGDRCRTRRGGLLCALLLALASAPAGSEQLFGVGWGGWISELDPATGEMLSRRATGFPLLNAGAVDPRGRAWTVGAFDNVDGFLVEIDPVTGRGIAGPAIDFGARSVSIRGMAFSPDGTLFVSNQGACSVTGCPASPLDLYTVDVATGVGTRIGSLGGGIQGLTWGPGGLLGWDVQAGLVRIETTTALVTDVNPFVGAPGFIQAIEFTPEGTLFAIGTNRSSGSILYTVDIATGRLSPLEIESPTVAARGLLALRAPPAPRCGNGILQAGESCDDGNSQEGDGCTSRCTCNPDTTPLACSISGQWTQYGVNVVGVSEDAAGNAHFAGELLRLAFTGESRRADSCGSSVLEIPGSGLETFPGQLYVADGCEQLTLTIDPMTAVTLTRIGARPTPTPAPSIAPTPTPRPPPPPDKKAKRKKAGAKKATKGKKAQKATKRKKDKKRKK